MVGGMTISQVGGGLLVVIVAFIAADPFKLAPLAREENVDVKDVPQPPLGALDDVLRDEKNLLANGEIQFGNQIFGPESVTFDSQGRGPYAGVGDGRVVRWEGPEAGWVEFAVVINNRTEICDPLSPPAPNLRYEHLCGRPLGLRFDKKTGDLYIADAYFGIMVVGPEGGVAKVVTDEVDGRKFVFTNDLDIDDDGTIYFTVTSTKYPRSKFFLCLLEADDSGRFLKYDPKTKKTTVLHSGLQFPNGVTFSKDHSFIVVSETRPGRLLRYWVKGEKAGTMEHFTWLPGYSDNVRTSESGDFWVAHHCKRIAADRMQSRWHVLRSVFLKMPWSMRTLYLLSAGRPHGMVARYNNEGQIVQMLEDRKGKTVKMVSEVEEHEGKLYFGSVVLPHVAVYKL